MKQQTRTFHLCSGSVRSMRRKKDARKRPKIVSSDSRTLSTTMILELPMAQKRQPMIHKNKI